MGWSDSEQEGPLPPKKRIKRNKFKKNQTSLSEINVNTYRSLEKIDAVPFGDADSFFQERFDHWKEMDIGPDFRDVVEVLHSKCGSLVQVLHHKDEILEVILGKCAMDAILSAESLTDLLAALARDLQDLFVPMIPEVLRVVSDLIDHICSHPEPLEAAFRNLSLIFRHLSKLLVTKIAWLLPMTSRLRNHRVRHVRRLAAQSVSYLFRVANSKKLKTGIKCLFSEVCTRRKDDLILDGVGQTIAEACAGIQGRLHSRAEDVLRFATDSELLSPDEFKGKPKGKRSRPGDSTGGGNEERDSNSGPSWLTIDFIRDRCGEALRIGLEKLADFVENKEGQVVLVEVGVEKVRERMKRYEQCCQAGKEPAASPFEIGVASRDVARGVCCVALILEAKGGTCIRDFTLPIRFSSQLSSLLLNYKGEAGEARNSEVNEDMGVADLDHSECLTRQVLRLYLALVVGLTRANSLPKLEGMVQSWGVVFQLAKPVDLCWLTRQILSLGDSALTMFASDLLGALCMIVEGKNPHGKDDSTVVEALFLICEVSGEYRKMTGMQVPRLMLGGGSLAEHIVRILEKWTPPVGRVVKKDDISQAWLGLRCLPEVSAKPDQILQACRQLLATLQGVNVCLTGKDMDAVTLEDMLMLQAKARGLMAKALFQNLEESAVDSAKQAIGWLLEHPRNYHVLDMAADVLTMLRAGVDAGQYEGGAAVLSREEFEKLVEALGPLLGSRSQNVRKACLRLLCCFDAPNLKATEAQEKDGAEPDKCLIFQSILEIEAQPVSLENDHKAVKLTDTLKAYFESGRLHGFLVTPVLRSMMGMIFIRFSRIWRPLADAISVGAKSYPEEVWSLLFPLLSELQEAFLDGVEPSAKSGLLDDLTLIGRMKADLHSGGIEASGGHTDPLTCLSHFLLAIQNGGDALLKGRSEEWVELFLNYLDRRPGNPSWKSVADSSEDNKKEQGCRFPHWRKGVSSWLSTISSGDRLQKCHRSTEVLQRISGLLCEDYRELQTNGLHCLQAFKVKHFSAYMDNLRQMLDPKTLRQELLNFPIRDTSDSPIPEEHRPGLVPILTYILHPKYRRLRDGKLKGANLDILQFFGSMRTQELRFLLGRFLSEIGIVFVSRGGEENMDLVGIQKVATLERNLLLPQPWWVNDLDTGSGAEWLGWIQEDRLKGVPISVKQKTLDNLNTLFKALGYKLVQYLNPILALLTHLLEGFTVSLENDQSNPQEESTNPQPTETKNPGNEGPEEEEKDPLKLPTLLRQCLDIIGTIWVKFSDSCDHSPFINRILAVFEPWMHDLPKSGGKSISGPLLLRIAGALSSDPKLVKFLAASEEGAEAGPDSGRPELGCLLLSQVVSSVACLTFKQSFHDSVLDVIDNLLEQGEETVEAVLKDHIPCLLEQLKIYIVAVFAGNVAIDSGTMLKIKREADRELSILERVAAFAMDSGPARSLTQALLPLLGSAMPRGKHRPQHESVVMRTLNCLAAVWERLGSSISTPGSVFSEEEILGFSDELAVRASQLKEQEARVALATCFRALGTLLPDLIEPARLFTDLNSFMEDLSGTPDYDCRLAAYGELSCEAWQGMTHHRRLPILHTCLFDLENPDDISLRQAASEALSRFLSSSPDVELVPEATMYVYKKLCKGLGAQNLAVRQEHVARVRQVISKFPASFQGLFSLVNLNDEEQDFFNNVSHLQLHRRARAWVHVTKLIEKSEDLATRETMVVLVPLILQAIFDGRAGETSGRKMSNELDQSREHQVIEATIQVLSKLSHQLSWELYGELLSKLLSSVHRADTPSKGMVKAMCVVIDALPFEIPDPGEKDALREALGDSHMDENDTEENQTDQMKKGREVSKEEGQVISHCMYNRVLPTLKKLLLESEEKARPAVAKSMVRLLRRMPPRFEQFEMRGALQRVANILKHRRQAFREDARAVFIGMAKELGSKYLEMLMIVLKAALPEKGFSVHVLGFTMHAVLEAVAESTAAGDADAVVNLVLPIIDAELFGEVAEAKEVKQFTANYKEAKACRAYESAYLLMKLANFERCADDIMQLVRARLNDCTSPKLRNRLTELLVYLSKGVLDSTSASLVDLMSFVHDLIGRGMKIEMDAIAQAEANAGVAGLSSLKFAESNEASVSDRYEALLVEFALKILHNGLKKGKMDVKNVEVLGLLDPLLPLLVSCLKSRHAPVSKLALQCVCFLVRLPLPGLGEAAVAAGNTVMMMLDKVSTSTDPVAQDCFNFLAKILRAGDAFEPTNDQVNSLLVLIATDLEEHAQRHSGFNLIRAMVDRKVMVPALYDVMKTVQEMMIRSQVSSVRETCSSLLLQFLLTYPLGEVRLMDHLKFVMTNLSYEYETGRLQALGLLGMIMQKFPAELLDVQADFFFLPLIVRLANDDSRLCREQIAEGVKTMLKRIGRPTAEKLMDVAFQWLESDDLQLRRTASQALGFFVELRTKIAIPHEEALLESLGHVLAKHVQLIEASEESDENDGGHAVLDWQEVYSALCLLEKVAEHFGKKSAFLGSVSGEVDDEGVETRAWNAVVSLLRYRHAWVRKVSVRLIVKGLAVLGTNLSEARAGVLLGGRTVSELAFLLFVTIEAGVVDPDLAVQATKCLVWIAPQLHLAVRKDNDPVAERLDNEGEETAGGHVEAENEGRSAVVESDGNSDFETAVDDVVLSDEGERIHTPEIVKNQGNTGTGARRLSLFGLVQRMARIADDHSALRREVRLSALKFFAALGSRLGPDDVVRYLPAMMMPIYRILEAAQKSEDVSEVKTVAEEVQVHIRGIVGSDVLLSAFNEARRTVQARRMQRKKTEKLQRITDPEAAARRRIKRNRNKLEWRKMDGEFRKATKALTKRRKRG
ncbi:hypothetical protein BSKO_07791 [Bryopsis sp. KO-2023]|nr:hypothetical protein BSKO_07791 [Bryopsis sp. KO-2023]